MGLVKKTAILLSCLFSLSFILLVFPSKIHAAQCGSNTANPSCIGKSEGSPCINNAMDGGPGVCQITGTGNFCSCQPPLTTPPTSAPQPQPPSSPSQPPPGT